MQNYDTTINCPITIVSDFATEKMHSILKAAIIRYLINMQPYGFYFTLFSNLFTNGDISGQLFFVYHSG